MILGIIKQLREVASANSKKAILEHHKHNAEWLRYLVSVYDPFIVYGVSGDKNGDMDDLQNLRLCRSINAGVTATTINKVYKGLIPTAAKNMKALDISPYAKASHRLQNLKFPLCAGLKYDGNYTIITLKDGKQRYFTSGGHEYAVHPPYEPIIGIEEGVYLAERIKGEGKLGDRRGCSLKGPRGTQCSIGHKFKIFDYIQWDDFNTGSTDMHYIERHEYIKHLPDLAETKIIHNMDDLHAYATDAYHRGYEGLIIKDLKMKWRDSKSRKLDFCKYKQRHTADLLCIEETEGTGKYQDMIGSLKLRDKDGVEVDVGSGLTDADRQNWGNFLGKVIEIEYEQIINTYIQPTFKFIRDDKSTDDLS